MSTAIGQHIDERAWLEERRKGIGGSDVAAIFGLHPFKTARDVWLEKMGRAPEKPPTPDMLRGRALEDVAVQLYTERTGRRVRRVGLRKHRDFPHLLASIDRQVFARDDFGTSCLEVKCPRSRTFYRMKREGLPDYIVLQGQHEALVWGYEQTEFAIFGADDFELLTFAVPFDADVSRRIIEVCCEWWHLHIERGIEPEEKAPVPDVKLPDVPGELQRKDDPQFLQAARDYTEARELAKEAEAVKEQARDRLIQVAGALGKYQAADQFLVYYTEQPGRAQHAETVKALKGVKPLDRLKVAAFLNRNAGAEITGDFIAQLVDECVLEFGEFEKVGKPSRTLNVYALRATEE